MTFQPPAAGESESSFPPFLTAEILPKKGSVKVKILDVRSTPDAEFSDFALDAMYDGEKRSIGMKAGNPNHQILERMFGEKTPKWIGKTIQLERKHSRKYKVDFVSVVEK